MSGALQAKALFLAISLLAGAGCQSLGLRKKPTPPRPFVPPPPVVRTMPMEPLVVGEPPPNPGLFADVSAIPYPIFGPVLELPERPKPPVARTKPIPTPATPPEQPVEPVPPPVSVPKLTQILDPEEIRSYRAEVDEAARSVERVLEAAGRRQLTATQTELAQQVRTFVRLAQEQRETDLATARNLARRAMILARDLQSTFR